jgi:hypothetical protein
MSRARRATPAAQEAEYKKYQDLQAQAIEDCPPYPDNRFRGRGIVMCAGGPKYFPCAYVNIRMLRHLDCTLPVEVWHLGPSEMEGDMRRMLKSLGNVEVVDAHQVAIKHPVRILNGWELKPYAITHSSFEEVLFLDSDNTVAVDPAFLFDIEPYKKYGSLFWPDYQNLAPSRSIWKIMDIEYRDEPEFESGQIVVDKRRCWKELNFCIHLNSYSDFYYIHIHGDKETFHMAWRKLDTPYGMCPSGIHKLPENGIPGIHGSIVMCQHDWDKNIVFQHRNMAKFTLPIANNPRIKGFRHEDICIGFLDDLSKAWRGNAYGTPRHEESAEATAVVKQILEQGRFTYERIGLDSRPMQFLQNNKIGQGSAGCEQFWYVCITEGTPELVIEGREAQKTAWLHQRPDGVWDGHWVIGERCRCTLTPLSR